MRHTIFNHIATHMRQHVSLVFYHLDNLLDMKGPSIIVLNYHSISNDEWFHGVSLSMLKKQITYLQKAQYKFISLEDLTALLAQKKVPVGKSVTITFDDGYKNILQTREFFRGLGIKPAVFLLADTKHARRDELDNQEAFLTDAEVIRLEKDGWSLGSHSGTHPQLPLLNKKDSYKEIILSKKELEKRLHKKVHFFAYPKGKYNSYTKRLVKEAGYKLALTMDDGYISTRTNLFEIPRIGINRSHSLAEFKTLWSPSVISSRKFLKKIIRF